MSQKLEEWALEFKHSYGEQITTRLKRLIKKNTNLLIRTIKDKEIGFGDFTDEINHRMAIISYLKSTLRGMLGEDLDEYKDYLRACIREGYTIKFDDDSSIDQWLDKYQATRAIRFRKLKGILLRKLNKYSA